MVSTNVFGYRVIRDIAMLERAFGSKEFCKLFICLIPYYGTGTQML